MRMIPRAGIVLADDLHDLGYRVSERRVWRLCRLAGIRSVITTRKRRYKKAGAPVHDDLVKRDFTAEGPNQLWLTDINRALDGRGKLYCCAVKDVWSNRIVGYAIDKRMKARLAVNALEMAVTHRGNPTGVVVHSDRGSQGELTGRRNTLTVEVFSCGDDGLGREDERCARGCASAMACGSGAASADAFARVA